MCQVTLNRIHILFKYIIPKRSPNMCLNSEQRRLLMITCFFFCTAVKKKALTILEELKKQPVQYFWWSRYDLQTEVLNEDQLLSFDVRKQWMEHPDVIQGGELTGWPRLMDGDDLMLHCMQATKKLRKRIEGHFPGASEKTLTKMKLFGADSDHEAMNGGEVMRRLELGYYVSLRHSSIRPDLRTILQDLHQKRLPAL